jgi:hypothetical protein
VLVGLPLIAGLVHVALVAPHYFVGSFDDDSSYILTAHALLAGHGLTGQDASGAVVAGLYPPGYGALIAPPVWLWPHTFVPLRLLSVACYAGLFPLIWIYLRRRGVGEGVRTFVLWLLALGPALATFGSMVMAEAPFLVLFMVFLLLIDRWEQEDRALTRTGIGVVVAAAGLVWIKEAGIGIVAGLVLWYLVGAARATRPRWRSLPGRRAAAVAAGVIALLMPVVVARIVAGVPITGARYSAELGAYYHGSMLSRLVHVTPHGLWQMFSTALPATLVPYGSPLPGIANPHDVGHLLWEILAWQVTVLVVIGFVVWVRRYPDATVAIVPAYLAMTLLWPYVNERRVILVIPIVAAWYVIGGATIWRAVRDRWPRPRLWSARVVGAALVAAVVVIPLARQAPRDYLFGIGQHSSQFEGSRYAAMLAHLGTPSDVVETDYLSSTALFTGHRTAWNAFEATITQCYLPAVLQNLAADQAGYLLIGAVNKPGLIDRPCLLDQAKSGRSAVQLLSTARDDASVFELIGPGTGHPDLRDLGSGVVPTTTTTGTTARTTSTVEWNWGAIESVSQVSAGEVGVQGGADVRSVALQIDPPSGVWQTVAGADSMVGDGRGAAPYLLAELPSGTMASAMRVVVTSSAGPAGPGRLSVADVHALGPGAGT